MKIYIASSWKNQHAVEMLTDRLREIGHEVISFVEKAVCDEGRSEIRFDVDQMVTWFHNYRDVLACAESLGDGWRHSRPEG